MDKTQRLARNRPTAGHGLDLILVTLLFAVALAIRWLHAQAVVFPFPDEPAFFLTTAENLVTGRGLEVDVLWFYRVPFSSVTHPSHEYWMPLTTGLIAAALAVQRVLPGDLATALPAGQMPGLILGALLAPLTYLVGRRLLAGVGQLGGGSGRGSRWLALGAGLLVAVNATLSYQSASADSSAPFVLLAAWALAVAVHRPGERGGYFGAGLLVATACLIRADAVLLLLAIPLAWWLLPLPPRPAVELPDNPAAALVWRYWPRQKGGEEEQQRLLGPSMVHVLDLAVAFALLVTPWLLRNYLVFGTPWPGGHFKQAWLTDYVDTFNYWSQPTWQTWLAQGWQALLDQRLQALLHNSQVFLLSTFPWGLLALPGLWLLRREWSFFSSLVYGLALFFGLALVFPASSMSGAFYHSFGSVLPFLALAVMVALQRGIQAFGRYRRLATLVFTTVAFALLMLAGVQMFRALPSVAVRHQAAKGEFEAAAAWLAQHALPGDVVMTSQPYTLNYASGHPCIALPGSEPPDAAWEAAQRYGARYLVITQPFGQYPQVLHDQPDPRFRLLEANETAEIYEILSSTGQ